MRNMRARVTKLFCFEMAHALHGYDGPCKNIHGHSYRLSVTVIGKINSEANHSKSGMVMDFTNLKSIVDTHIIKQFDHTLVLNEKHAQIYLSENTALLENVKIVKYQPTCENLAAYFAGEIKKHLPSTIKLHHLKLQETPTSYTEWHAEDNSEL